MTTTLFDEVMVLPRWYQSLAEYRYATLQRFNVRLAVEPTLDQEPITLEEAWHQLNLVPWGSPLGTEHDDWLTLIGIPGARSWAEAYLGLSLAEQTLELTTDRFPSDDFIDLPFGPVQSIESITYLDEAGDEQTVDELDYRLDNYSQPHRVYLEYDTQWPTETRQVRNAIRIRYVVGNTQPGLSPPGQYPLPPRIRIALLFLVGHLHKNREHTTTIKVEEIPLGARSFLDWDRVRLGFA